MARTYAKVDGGALTYPNWMEAIRDGESYVSDGRSHLMDFTVNGIAKLELTEAKSIYLVPARCR